ncbi:MAG: acetyl-CoA carboxylase biotin carboxyl carrier protein subunit [bacterium]|nr:acetyl-CoA carboxylase biotin carboxyl carrier protein subunit [bacterium]
MGEYIFTINGKDYKVNVNAIDQSAANVEINGKTFVVNMKQVGAMAEKKDSKKVQQNVSQETKKIESGDVRKILAPLPGVILNVMVKEGQEIKEGQDVMVMEAMKMENSIHSPYTGKVIRIAAKKDDTVAEGDVLIEIGA